MASNKKHYTDAEKKFFLRILVKYSHIIERKKSDATTLKDKEEAWNQICDSYNLSSIITSGGPEPTSAEIDPDIAAIAPNLMTTAPTLFSSNLSDEVIQERQQRILNDDCIPEELLTKYVENESSVDDNFKEVTNENLIIVRDTEESNSEIDEADKENTDILNTKHAILSNYKASTSKNVPVQKKRILEDINDIVVLTPKKEIKKLQLENEENNNEKLLNLKRIKSIIDREQQLANLNIRHQEVIQKLEIDHLKEKYALEIRAATAAAELSELLLKEKQNK
ncbi:uncharacterized protein LOC118646214 isoform X2 [Monomorium pharaonis]|uniref:uncharacterized protein LOC118646214 isoform X2 n=1 Tax=Monomorium pharaonis TaxID=307658 RepID=UPI001747C9DC|nr:uncharacterized protein LOC118646214 isoform X2 [Monomorium pharaonis]